MLIGIKSDDYILTLVNVDRWLYFLKFLFGGLAQLARAPALHAGGQGFDSLILHHEPWKLNNVYHKKTKKICNNKSQRNEIEKFLLET